VQLGASAGGFGLSFDPPESRRIKHWHVRLLLLSHYITKSPLPAPKTYRIYYKMAMRVVDTFLE
jgi:hypothetical protein